LTLTKAKRKWCKRLTDGFHVNSVAACMMESGEEDDQLQLTADIC
jgi:hypothetical protein